MFGQSFLWHQCQILQTIYVLLKSKSEQERKLLSALVNKVSSLFILNLATSNIELFCLIEVTPTFEPGFLSASIIWLKQLGDPENKAASNADFHLANLLSDHPNMKVRLSGVVATNSFPFIWCGRLCACFNQSHIQTKTSGVGV